MSKRFPVLWLTGNTGAGKSTLAEGMKEYFNEQEASGSSADRRVVVLDGDQMRATVSRDEGLSPEDRRKHNLRVARLANLLSDHGFLVIVAVIAPFSGVREELQVLCNPTWVYVKRSGLGAEDRPYEPPETPDLTIDNDVATIEEGREILKEFIVTKICVASAVAA
jgi:adenylylsulfate kinase-like enzyme